MSDAEKEPWVRMADDEKRAHFLAYPGYRFSRVGASTARATTAIRNRGDDTTSSKGSSSPKSNEPLYLTLPSHDDSHPASETPGAVDIRADSPKEFDALPEPIVAHDELGRRPSRVMLSESACYEDFYSGFDEIHAHGDYMENEIDAMSHHLSRESEGASARDWQDILEDRHRPRASSDGPRLNAIRMPMPGMDHPSELDVVDTWDEYHAAQRRRAITPPEKEPTQVCHSRLRSITDHSHYLYHQDGLEYSSLMIHHSIDLDLSPTLPPLPLLQTPESSDGENYYPAPASPIERNSFYSPRSGTWKLPLPVMTSNAGAGSGFNSTSHIDSGLLFADNLIDDELRYPHAEGQSGRTRASLSWILDRSLSDDRFSVAEEHDLHHHEAQGGHRDSWRLSRREIDSPASTSSSKDTPVY